MNEYLVISTSIDLMRTASGNIVFISSDGNYSSFVFTNGDSRVITMQLGQVERVLSEQLPHSGSDFIRIGKSLIINRNYISYITSIEELSKNYRRTVGHGADMGRCFRQLRFPCRKGVRRWGYGGEGKVFCATCCFFLPVRFFFVILQRVMNRKGTYLTQSQLFLNTKKRDVYCML